MKSKHFSLLFAITLLMFSQSLYSQCKLEKTSDDYSSSLTVSSKDVTLVSVFPLIGSKKPWDITMQFSVEDSTCNIIVIHASQSYSTDFQSIFFKFEDGSVMKMEHASGSGDYNNGFGYKFTATYFSISKEELIEFSQKNLSKVQAIFTHFPDYPVVDQEIKKKNVEKIRIDATCILSEFNLYIAAQKKIKFDPQAYLKEECLYENIKIDDFTKKRTVLTKAATIYEVKNGTASTSFMNVCGSNINGVNGLQLNRGLIVGSGAHVNDEASLKSGMLFDQVDLLLVNEEVVNLKLKGVSDYIRNGYTYFSFKLITIENDSIWKKLEIIPIKKIKLGMNGNDLGSLDVKKLNSTSFMKVINCINKLGKQESK